MQTYSGVLKRVGSREEIFITSNQPAGNVRTGGEISIVEIGDTVLRKPRCPSDLYDVLDPGREAYLYIFRHFFYKPVIIGVKYPDDGKKYTITLGQALGSAAQYVLLWPLLFIFSGFMIGLMGGKEGGIMAIMAMLWIFGGIGLAWLSAVLLLVDFGRVNAA